MLEIIGHVGTSARTIDVSPDRRHALIVTMREVVLWDFAQATAVRAEVSANAARFLTNDRALIGSSSLEWTVNVVAIPSLASVESVARDRGQLAHLDTDRGRALVASDECVNPLYDHHTGRVWVIERDGTCSEQPNVVFDDAHLEGAVWLSPTRVAAWFEDSSEVEVHELGVGRVPGEHRTTTFWAHPKWVGRLSADELIAACSDGLLCTWHVGNASPRLEVRIAEEGSMFWPPPAVALSPDRRIVAVLNREDRLRVFETRNGHCRLDTQTNAVACAFSGAREMLLVLADGQLARLALPD